jgi:predicted nucleic acid-binding protein
MILDSDILIDLERKEPNALAWLRSSPEAPATSGFVAFELVAGCKRKNDLRKVQKQLAQLRILWPNEPHLMQALRHFQHLHLSQGVGIADMLIAATALAHGRTLVTCNDKHFRAIPGLKVLVPYNKPVA